MNDVDKAFGVSMIGYLFAILVFSVFLISPVLSECPSAEYIEFYIDDLCTSGSGNSCHVVGFNPSETCDSGIFVNHCVQDGDPLDFSGYTSGSTGYVRYHSDTVCGESTVYRSFLGPIYTESIPSSVSCVERCGYTVGTGNVFKIGGDTCLSGLGYLSGGLIPSSYACQVCGGFYSVGSSTSNCTGYTPTGNTTPVPTPILTNTPMPTYTPVPTNQPIVTLAPVGTSTPGGIWTIPTAVGLNQTYSVPNFSAWPTIPPNLPVIPDFLNSTSWRIGVANTSFIGPYLNYPVTWISQIGDFFNSFIMLLLSIAMTPFAVWNGIWVYSVGLNNSLVSGFLSTIGVFVSVMFQILAAFPQKVINTATILMTFNVMETFIEMIRSGDFKK